MPSFSHAVVVREPPDAVFPWLLEADRVPRWTSDLDVYEVLAGGSVREGARIREQLEISGHRFAIELHVTRYDPPRSAESRFSTNGIDVVSVYTLEPEGDGTRLTQSVEAKPRSFGARMLLPVVWPRLQRKLPADLERLRELLDGAP